MITYVEQNKKVMDIINIITKYDGNCSIKEVDDACSELYTIYKPLVIAKMKQNLDCQKDEALALEAYDESFLILLDKIQSGHIDKSQVLYSWLTRTSNFVLKNNLRKQNKGIKTIIQFSQFGKANLNPEDRYIEIDDNIDYKRQQEKLIVRKLVEEMFQSKHIKEKYKQVLKLKYLESLKEEEVAKILKIDNLNTLKSSIRYAKSQAKDWLNKNKRLHEEVVY